ncbi:MAG: hypothetical protein BGO49_25920 [Planctomycetales bacterium 71-10]|nr:MAG: hypothetical protein BGO49_25920 [Planctomycetales bacterium 71-10]
MLALMLTLLIAETPTDDPAKADARRLLETIEALQQPIEDFRCEFEGEMKLKNQAAEGVKLGEDGLLETFSGVFTWRRGGDTHNDSLKRNGADGTIMRQNLIVRVKENQAEEYYRQNDAPIGYSVIKDPREVNPWSSGSYGDIFLIDKMKRDVADEGLSATVRDDELEGRPVKVLTIAVDMGDEKDINVMSYWIDLRRSGQVIRQDAYMSDVVAARHDIVLSPFKVGDAEVWMPTSGEFVGRAAGAGEGAFVASEPTVLSSTRVVEGTMEFNRRPGREEFTMKYKPRTPISDHLKQLTSEFGDQKIPSRPKPADARRMLEEQVAKADEQASGLVTAIYDEGDWTRWLPWAFGVVAVASVFGLWVQRRGG